VHGLARLRWWARTTRLRKLLAAAAPPPLACYLPAIYSIANAVLDLAHCRLHEVRAASFLAARCRFARTDPSASSPLLHVQVGPSTSIQAKSRFATPTLEG